MNLTYARVRGLERRFFPVTKRLERNSRAKLSTVSVLGIQGTLTWLLVVRSRLVSSRISFTSFDFAIPLGDAMASSAGYGPKKEVVTLALSELTTARRWYGISVLVHARSWKHHISVGNVNSTRIPCGKEHGCSRA